MSKINIPPANLPPFVHLEVNDLSYRDKIETLATDLRDRYTEVVNRLTNREVKIDFELTACSSITEKENESFAEDVSYKVYNKSKQLIISGLLGLNLVEELGQAALGANNYRKSEEDTKQSQFTKSFSQLFIKVFAETAVAAFKNVITSINQEFRIEIEYLKAPHDEVLLGRCFKINFFLTLFDERQGFSVFLYKSSIAAIRTVAGEISSKTVSEANKIKVMTSLSQAYITIKGSMRNDEMSLSQIRSLRVGSLIGLKSGLQGKILISSNGCELGLCSIVKGGDQITLRVDEIF